MCYWSILLQDIGTQMWKMLSTTIYYTAYNYSKLWHFIYWMPSSDCHCTPADKFTAKCGTINIDVLQRSVCLATSIFACKYFTQLCDMLWLQWVLLADKLLSYILNKCYTPTQNGYEASHSLIHLPHGHLWCWNQPPSQEGSSTLPLLAAQNKGVHWWRERSKVYLLSKRATMTSGQWNLVSLTYST